MMCGRLSVYVLYVFLLMSAEVLAQGESDTTRKAILDSRVSQEIIKSVTRKPQDENVRTVKSEDIYKPYEGRIIRYIIIKHVGFERSIYDTARNVRDRITRLADALHSDTRQGVIRDNLFIREHRPLNPYLLADNERYLRDLDFILDSKIIVLPVSSSRDSVDVIVATRDVFSLGVRTRASGLDKVTVGIYDANLLGMGQRVQTNWLFQQGRNPFIGREFYYTKSSVAGSLANLSLGYTELNNGRSVGEENEYAYYIKLDRPLVSPYSHLAGGVELSRNWARNVSQVSDSLFRRYTYNIFDLWGGYNIGAHNRTSNRNRHFLALRYADQHFIRQPLQFYESTRLLYNNQRFLLGEITFYNQNFYKTRYVYGFGRTEDVPYGQTANITAGWSEALGKRRAYVAAYVSRRIVERSGRFYDIEAGAGTFFNERDAEDGVVYGNATFYSKLYQIGKTKVRHQIAAGYAKMFNHEIRDLLTLNSELRGFSPDSLFGYQRAYLRTETTLYTKWRVAGFGFAPFMSLEGALFQSTRLGNLDDRKFWGTTGGLRVRNENLIFGTVEFRAFYFPTTVRGVSPVSFRVTTNVRIKYSGTFVRPPEFLRYN